MPTFYQQIVGSFVRTLLASVFGWLVQRGFVQADQTEALIVGLTGIVLTIGWSVYQKYVARQKVVTALTLPAHMTEDTLDQKIAAGAVASVLTATDAVPFAATPTQ